MGTPYADVLDAFLFKITEHKFLKLNEADRDAVISIHMKSVCSKIAPMVKKLSGVDLTQRDDEDSVFSNDLSDELIDIISEGMIVRWLKPYAFSSDNLENVLSTKEIALYSPANLLREIAGVYKMAAADFKQQLIDYSYQNGEIGV